MERAPHAMAIDLLADLPRDAAYVGLALLLLAVGQLVKGLLSALVVAGSLQGQGGGVHTTLACFVLSQLGLVAYGALYRRICGYDVHAEIERDNVAAGVAFGLHLVAMGLLSMKAVSGDFTGWSHQLVQFGVTYGAGVVFLVTVRFLVDYLLLPGVRIHHEIARDRNLNAAWIEGVAVAGMAGLLAVVL